MDADEVRLALSCLYDPLELSRSSLGDHFPGVRAESNTRARAHSLRAILLDAIEALQPSSSNLALTPALRGYELLYLHFVQRLSLAEAAEELHISTRQAYRDLSLALDKLAEYLEETAKCEEEVSKPKSDASEAALIEELDRLAFTREEVDAQAVVNEAIEIVMPFAQSRRCNLKLSCGNMSHPAVGELALLRNLLVRAFSLCLRHCDGREINVNLREDPGYIVVEMEFASRTSPPPEAVTEIQEVSRVQSIEACLTCAESGKSQLGLRIPASRRSLIVIIEDNPGVCELYRRFLEESDQYEVASVPAPEEAIACVESLQPDVVILDILMPGQDGWSILRSLKASPCTARIPVLVCSVFGEMELAAALGASAYIRKPVVRDEFMDALRRCLSLSRQL